MSLCGRFGANITQSGEAARRSADAMHFLGIRQLPHGFGVPCAKAGQHSAALPARGSVAYGKGDFVPQFPVLLPAEFTGWSVLQYFWKKL